MVYLLCFDKKYKHAKHYIGFAHNEETFKKRIEHHRKGQGARLMAVIAKAGIGFHVSRTWPEGDKNFERKLKNQKKASALCPHCKTVAKAEKLRQKHIKYLAENPPSPEFQKMVDKLKDPKEFNKLFEQFGERSEHDPKFTVCPVVAQVNKELPHLTPAQKDAVVQSRLGIQRGTDVSQLVKADFGTQNERAEVAEMVAKGNALAKKFGVEDSYKVTHDKEYTPEQKKAIEEAFDAKSTSVYGQGGWSRIRSALARFWQLFTS